MINKLRLQEPIDKLSMLLIGGFSVLIGGLMIGDKLCGENCFLRKGPQVESFTWQEQNISNKDRAFILTFDRPMDKATVEKNLEKIIKKVKKWNLFWELFKVEIGL